MGPSFEGQKSSWAICLLKTFWLWHSIQLPTPPSAWPGPFLVFLLRPRSFPSSLLAPVLSFFIRQGRRQLRGLPRWWCVPSCCILQGWSTRCPAPFPSPWETSDTLTVQRQMFNASVSFGCISIAYLHIVYIFMSILHENLSQQKDSANSLCRIYKGA